MPQMILTPGLMPAADPETASGTGVGERQEPRVIARRLGIGVRALETYMRSHGGVPDGIARALPAVLPPADGVEAVRSELTVLVFRALPAPKQRAPWVKRDRPRYFMPG